MNLRWMAALLLIPAFADERIEMTFLDQKILADRLAQGLVPMDERESTIAAMFRAAGCEVELQKVTRKANNVICTLPGQSTDSIIAGGHYDFVPAGKGIIDDWSGTSMLVSLYQSLKAHPRKHTFVFVAFAREETGEEGSKKYVHELGKDRLPSVRAFVNLECLGTAPTEVWNHRADPTLLRHLGQVAASLQMKISGMNVDKVGDDDSHSFMNASVPVITLHSLTQETLGWIHNNRDRLESIQPAVYYDSYKLIALFLAYLDSTTAAG